MPGKIQGTFPLAFLLSLMTMIACVKEEGYKQYRAMVDEELSSGKQVDSVFLGIRLGMTSDDFYAHCWEMNKKGLLTDGKGNTAVLYKLENGELKYPANMNFYPDFYNEKVIRMRVSYQYKAWAPWNKELFADSLQQDVLRLYRKWYSEGNPFIKMEDKTKGTIYVKVDGNRRIIIGRYSDSEVKVDFTDLKLEEEIQHQHEKS